MTLHLLFQFAKSAIRAGGGSSSATVVGITGQVGIGAMTQPTPSSICANLMRCEQGFGIHEGDKAPADVQGNGRRQREKG